MNDLPIVLAFIEDLLTAVRIDNVTQELGFQFLHWEKPESDAQVENETPGRQWAEPLLGIEAAVIEKVAVLQPALIVFDLGNRSIPSLEWIATGHLRACHARHPCIGLWPTCG